MISKSVKSYFNLKNKILNKWAKKYMVGIFLFNIILSILVLLNAAEYFKPFFFLGINSIFFIMLILSIFLLGLVSKSMFIVSIIFLFFTAFLKTVNINIWAERTAIYTFEALIIGTILLVIESFKNDKL